MPTLGAPLRQTTLILSCSVSLSASLLTASVRAEETGKPQPLASVPTNTTAGVADNPLHEVASERTRWSLVSGVTPVSLFAPLSLRRNYLAPIMLADVEESEKPPTNRSLAAEAGLTLSRTGATGLIRIPTASVTPDGDFRFAAFAHTPSGDLTRLGNSSSFAVNVGFLPRLEFGLALGDLAQRGDLTANAKVQIVRETRSLPAFSVGALDFFKLRKADETRGVKTTYYGVLGRSLFHGRVQASLGILSNQNTRAFGGLEVGIARQIALMAEMDGHQFNAGVRANVYRNYVQVAAHYVDNGISLFLGTRFPLTTGHAAERLQTTELTRANANASESEAAKAIQSRLIEIGLENVRVRTTQESALNGAGGAGGLDIEYENRSYPHNEIDALANVLAAAATYAPDRAARVTVTVLRSAIPTFRMACPLDAYRDFIAGRTDTSAFARTIQVDEEVAARHATVTADSGIGASSYGHADIFLRPALTTQIATERYLFAVGLSFRPELDLPVAKGLGLNLRADIPVGDPGGLLRGNTIIDRAAINYSLKIGGPFLARAFFGRFPQEREGFVGEALYNPNGGPWLGRIAVSALNHTGPDGGGQKATYVGEARYYVPQVDLNISVNGGRYLEGDTGASLNLTRRFGNTEIGLEVRDTDLGRAGIIQLGIPLGPDHIRPRPSAVRVRPPDFLDYEHRSLLTRPNLVGIAAATGNEPLVGSDAVRLLLNRDRLNRPYLLRSLFLLRQVRPLPR